MICSSKLESGLTVLLNVIRDWLLTNMEIAMGRLIALIFWMMVFIFCSAALKSCFNG